MNEQNYPIFEAYLNGDLAKEELELHQKRLQNDQDYKESFELYKTINSHLEHEFENQSKLENFKSSVSNISKEYSKSREENKFPWLRIAIAASLIIAIGLYFYLGHFSKPRYEEIAQIPSIHLTVRGDDTEIYTKAENAFNQKQYSDAIAFFNQIQAQNSENQSIQLYLAIAYMEMESHDQARAIFDQIIKKKSSYAGEALWFASLNELKEKKYTACKEYLSMIKPSASRYEDAKDLLDRLN